MNANGSTISPVNMEDRKKLGMRAGDIVSVHQKIQDKSKTRLQVFEGVVLARKHGNEAGATFTVRKVSDGIGVEKIFPLYSPMIDKIEITRRSKMRRAKLYHIREKVAREIKRQMRRMKMMYGTTEGGAEAAAREALETTQDEEVARAAAESTSEAMAEDAPVSAAEVAGVAVNRAEKNEEVAV